MVAVAAIFLITIIVIVVGTLLQTKWKFRNLRHVPGPLVLPIIGNSLEFGRNNVDKLEDLCRIMRLYGSVCRIILTPNCYNLLIADPDLVEFFISSPKYIKKSEDYDLLRPWIGNGLLTSTGSYWQKRRKAITPAFHFKILDQFVSVFNSSAEILIEKLKNHVDEDFDIYPLITAYTLDVICETAMGTTVGAQEDPNNKYVNSVKTVCNIFMNRTFSIVEQYDMLFKLTNNYKIQQKNLKIIHDFTNSVIDKRRKELSNNEINQITEKTIDELDFGEKKRVAFLDLLLSATIDNKSLTDDDITEEVDTFMFEGHDTTASAISFALYELSRNPDIQEKLYAEICEVFSNDLNRQPTLQDLNNLKYLELVVKETLRLYPSVPMYSRELTEDATYNGVTYPKGVCIIFFSYFMHRRVELFQNPESFIPERFLTDIKHPFAYIPFSAGPRNCIGQKFAMYEIKATLMKIVREYEILRSTKESRIILSAEVVLKSANGVHVKLKKRK